MEFKKVKELLKKGDYESFYRRDDIQEAYNNHRKTALKMWENINDFMLNKLFGIKFRISSRGLKYVDLRDIPKHRITKLSKNNFCYYLEPGTYHYNLWKLNGKIDKDDVKNGIERLKEIYDIEDFVHWENPPHRKTIKGVEHIHIIFKGSPKKK